MEFLTDPIGWWVDPFVDNEFMRQALWAGLLTVVTTSVVGTWVVLRGLGFLGDALAHGVLPGIAIASIVGFNAGVGALMAAAAMVLGISLVRAHSPLPDDTSIGLLFVGFLAVAVMIMSTPSAARTGDLERFLFGSINAIDGTDLRRQLAVTFIILVGTLVLHRALLATTFDERLAGTFGFRPGLVRAALLALMALAIVASFETVGNLLVFAFLIAPPATATLLARRVPSIMVTAVGIGSFSAIVGLLISYHHGTGTGATMALCAVATFLVVMVTTALARRRAAGEPLPLKA
ncbi:MAG: metal ABC transporter permease [Acidimicrobiia bacterium]|nr:metal ABC transporter permease [Acidimicrobiia bacterium]